jgi:hypothetical protein
MCLPLVFCYTGKIRIELRAGDKKMIDLQKYRDISPGLVEWIEICNIQQIEQVGIEAETRQLTQEETNYSELAHFEPTGNYTVTLVLSEGITRTRKFTHAELFGRNNP